MTVKKKPIISEPLQLNVSNNEIYLDLLAYSKLHPEIIIQRMTYSFVELAYQWNVLSKGKFDPINFYKGTDLYIFDLSRYQIENDHFHITLDMISQMSGIIQEDLIVDPRILEFGGGIGQFSIHCARASLPVCYFDLDSPLKDYAFWRFVRNNVTIFFEDEKCLSRKWDFVNCMDVLEHIADFKKVINLLFKNAKYVFVNPDDIMFADTNPMYPMHISKFKDYFLTKFTKVEGYLYKSNWQKQKAV